jgi:hypothetical protein
VRGVSEKIAEGRINDYECTYHSEEKSGSEKMSSSSYGDALRNRSVRGIVGFRDHWKDHAVFAAEFIFDVEFVYSKGVCSRKENLSLSAVWTDIQ